VGAAHHEKMSGQPPSAVLTGCAGEGATEKNIVRSHMKEPAVDDLIAKVKAISESPQGELFAKIVDNFFEHLETEYFSEEDLADIEEGLEDIRQGRYLTLEEYRQGKRL
jgi:predicted transcriptional regulator